MMSRDIISGFLNSVPTFLDNPCAVWSGESIPNFLREIHKNRVRIEFMLFAPIGATLPTFLDPEDELITEYTLPANGGSLYVKENK